MIGQLVRSVLDLCLAILLITLSIPVVLNLLSSGQTMNTSFETFRIVNTYGAFGRFVYPGTICHRRPGIFVSRNNCFKSTPKYQN